MEKKIIAVYVGILIIFGIGFKYNLIPKEEFKNFLFAAVMISIVCAIYLTGLGLEYIRNQKEKRFQRNK